MRTSEVVVLAIAATSALMSAVVLVAVAAMLFLAPRSGARVAPGTPGGVLVVEPAHPMPLSGPSTPWTWSVRHLPWSDLVFVVAADRAELEAPRLAGVLDVSSTPRAPQTPLRFEERPDVASLGAGQTVETASSARAVRRVTGSAAFQQGIDRRAGQVRSLHRREVMNGRAVHGSVELAVQVERGRVREVVVVRDTTGNEAFTARLVQAVRSWDFEGATGPFTHTWIFRDVS